jgi:plastocyanin
MDKQRFKHAAWALVASAAIVGLAGCGGDSSNTTNPGVTPNSTITIVPGAFNKGMAAFSPPSDTVHVGNIIRMHNSDSITHIIQPSTLGGPNWGTISGGGQSDFTATAVGTWPYHCTVLSHTMSGELVIVP